MMWIIWPFRKKNFGSAWNVCADFRNFIDATKGEFLIQDEEHLPHTKRTIFKSICILLVTETDQKILDAMKECAFELAFFQPDVGDQPLHPLGVDLDRFEIDAMNSDNLARLSLANPEGKERYDRFKAMRDIDWDKMRATMARIPLMAEMRAAPQG